MKTVREKPHQPPPGRRIDPDDKVEEASHESFPASDPPSFSGSGAKRAGPHRPAGENPHATKVARSGKSPSRH